MLETLLISADLRFRIDQNHGQDGRRARVERPGFLGMTCDGYFLCRRKSFTTCSLNLTRSSKSILRDSRAIARGMHNMHRKGESMRLAFSEFPYLALLAAQLEVEEKYKGKKCRNKITYQTTQKSRRR